MKRSLVLGSIAGILLTVIAAYFLLNSNALKTPGTNKNGAPELLEDSDIPITRTFDRYSLEFEERKDQLAHREKLQPFVTLEGWDKATVAARLTNNLRFTSGCESTAPTRAIFVPPSQAAGILKSKVNIHFVGSDMPACFGVGWKIAIVEDDFVDGKTLYKVIGEATIDRVVEFLIDLTDISFFNGIGVYRWDVGYLANLNYGPFTSYGNFQAIHFTLNPGKPLFDPNVVPSFVPGAVPVKPAAIKKMFQLNTRLGTPVFVDARDRAHISAGYPGAIAVPFIPSNPAQRRFQLEFPVSLLAGAKFDLRALPTMRETALVVFGEDASDASPLWVIRALRQQNYHRLFYVEGGLKELEKLPAPLKF